MQSSRPFLYSKAQLTRTRNEPSNGPTTKADDFWTAARATGRSGAAMAPRRKVPPRPAMAVAGLTCNFNKNYEQTSVQWYEHGIRDSFNVQGL